MDQGGGIVDLEKRMSWGYILGVAIEVELKKMREREGMNQALLLGFWFRSLVIVVTLQ